LDSDYSKMELSGVMIDGWAASGRFSAWQTTRVRVPA
jgi:hypothetical protein